MRARAAVGSISLSKALTWVAAKHAFVHSSCMHCFSALALSRTTPSNAVEPGGSRHITPSFSRVSCFPISNETNAHPQRPPTYTHLHIYIRKYAYRSIKPSIPNFSVRNVQGQSMATASSSSSSSSSSGTTIPDLHTTTAMAGGRPYDMVVVGASGVVGKLMTQHLLRKYALGAGHGFRLALSARNKERLARVHGELAREERDREAAARALAEVPVLWGDVDSPDFAESVAKQARVVAASLTPYSKHGSKLVAACVEQGTSYVDISGEMLWLRESVERHHRPAEHKGIKIVHACGLGSIPADLSAMLMLRRLEEDKVTPTEIKFLMGPVYSSLGGGSMQSYATLIATVKTEGKIRAMLDPHFLAAPALGDVSRHHHHHEEKEKEEEAKHELAPVLQVAPKVFGIGFDWDLRRFTATLWLAALDDEVVARSAALLGYPKGLRYVEAQTYSPTLFGLVSAWLTFLAAYAFAGLLYLAPTRWLLTRLRPPGSGPNRLIRERGHGVAFLVAKGTTHGKGQVTYTGEFTMPAGDPGYQETAKMLVESALCLVLEEGLLPKRAGVLTPASAFGEVLMERLNKAANMEFKM